MKTLIVTLTFACFLSLSVAMAINTSLSTRTLGLCEYVVRQTPPGIPGAFIPSCDFNGNFLPQQCAKSTGYCWCVNVITGEEIPNTRTPPGTVPVNCDREFYCPFGWSRFGRLCFVFIDSPKTWVEAESYCMFEGANLASVQSPEQNHFLQSLTRAETHDFPPTWVGGHNCVNVLFWMWSDGSRFLYENWNVESNTRTSERCLQMNNGYEKKWDLASCKSELPFLCAKRV